MFVSFFIFGFSEKHATWAPQACAVGFIFGMLISSSGTTNNLIAWIDAKKTNYTLKAEEAWMYEQYHYRFSDGFVASEFTTSLTKSGKFFSRTGGGPISTESQIAIAPLVYEGWTQSETVPIWVLCHNFNSSDSVTKDIGTCLKTWDEPIRSGYVISKSKKEEALKVLEKAKEVHGLRSRVNPKILIWSNQLDENFPSEVAFPMSLIAVILAIFNLALFISFFKTKWSFTRE